MTLFYAPDIASSNILSEEESQHCTKVLRLKVGETVHLIDGKGGLYTAQITVAHPKKTEVEVTNVIHDFEKRPFRLHLAVAPTKNSDRFEWFVEKATEIGFDELTPLLCHYSERKIIKPERIEKILISAAKQSLKAYIPKLNPICPFAEFMQRNLGKNRYIAHCYDSEKQELAAICQTNENVVIMIGPEGDFSLEEVALATRNGFQNVALGNSRLRTETAALVACHTVTVVNSLAQTAKFIKDK